MSNLKNLNKAPETRVLIAAGRGMVRRTGVSSFISQNRNLRFLWTGFVSKREGQIQTQFDE